MNMAEVENFPGFPSFPNGIHWLRSWWAKLRGQVERFGAELVGDDVLRGG
jgi:hypothetical protein